MREHTIEVDAILMGGGVSGCFAALELAERNRSVLMVDKAPIRRSGNAGMGVDNWLVTSPLVGDLTDDPALYHDLERHTKLNFLSGMEDIGDPTLLGLGASEECLELLHEIEAMGIPVRDRTGALHLTRRSGGTAIWIQGGELKTKLAERVSRAGVDRAEHVMLTDLLTDSAGRVAGAVGFHCRSGALYVIRAKSVLVATGRATRIYHPFIDDRDPDHSFDNVIYPYDTGDGQMAAYRAGAAVTNMEFMALTVTTRDHGSAGISGFLAAGCRIVNASGEQFMARYDPDRLEAGPRQKVVHAVLREIEEGRGPVYLDTTVLSEGDVADLELAWGNELPLFPRLMREKGIVPGRDLIEIVPTIPVAYGQLAVTDTSGASTLPGLFGAGDCTNLPWQGAQGAAITGKRAGRGIDAYLQARGGEPASQVDPEQLAARREALYRPLRAGGPDRLRWQEVASELRSITGAYLGIRRSAQGIREGRRRLERLAELLPRMTAETPHELMRLHETLNGVQFAQLMAIASEERRESRLGNGMWFLRGDHPETRDEEYSLVYVERDPLTGGPRLTRHESSVPLAVMRKLAEMLAVTPATATVGG